MLRQLALACVVMCVVGVLGVIAQNQGSSTPPNPNTVRLVGNRFPPLTYQQMNPEQQKMFENLLAGERRGAGGPFNVLLRSPEMGDVAQKLGAYLRFHSSIPRKLNEMAILITARHWTAQYEWYAHRRIAQEAGLSQPIIDALAAGTRPPGMQPDEEAVYTFCTELITTKEVSDKTFQAAKDRFGERGVVDLIGVTGYYGLVSMILNTDRYPMPNGVPPELKPLTGRSRPSSAP